MPIAFVSGGLLSRTLPPNRRNKTLCAPTNFHLPAVLRTQRTLGGSGTPQEIPGHLPRVRSAFAGAAGSSALRWPPLRSWPLVGCGWAGSWRQELQVGHARKFSTHYFRFFVIIIISIAQRLFTKTSSSRVQFYLRLAVSYRHERPSHVQLLHTSHLFEHQ